MQSQLTRPAVGLNSYTPAGSINENYMSDMIDAEPYREEAVKFSYNSSLSKYFSVNGEDEGRIIAVHELYNEDYDSGDIAFVGLAVPDAGWYLFYGVLPLVGAETFTQFTLDLPSGTTPAYAFTSKDRFSDTIFRTEADTFHCFVSSRYNRLYYLRETTTAYTTPTYGYVDLPFYPQSMVSHANRLFAIDTNNKLWWCRGGDLFSWYSLEYDDDRLLALTNMSNTSYSLIADIDTPRVITITCHTIGDEDTRGQVTLTGTNALGDALTSVVTLPAGDGSRVQTPEVFASIDTAVHTGWTIAGTADQIEIGVGPVGSGFVVDDAGYWTIDTERKVDEIFVVSNVLYISGGTSIYAFRGYSYETFNLQLLFSNLGNPKKANFGYKSVVIGRNRAYFISGSDIFEFNGDSAPRPINRPVYVNNALTNSIMGGVGNFNITHWSLESTDDRLYVYLRPNYTEGSSFDPSYYYIFDYETRTWWKKSGWSEDHFTDCDSLSVRVIKRYDNSDIWVWCWQHDSSTEDDFWFLSGSQAGGAISDSVYPFVITKSYQTMPSEQGTLSSIVLLMKSTDGLSADIEVLYSLTENGDDFQQITKETAYEFSGDMERFQIPLHPSFIANAHHYRLKIIVSNHILSGSARSDLPVYLYNIERRFRVRGYSR